MTKKKENVELENNELENNELENNELDENEVFGITDEEFLEIKEDE